MDFSVFLKTQEHTTELPCHRATRTLVALVLSARLANRIGQNAIQLTTEDSWHDVKHAVRNGLRVIRSHYIPARMPTLEPAGDRFKLPTAPGWCEEHMPPTQSLRTRAALTARSITRPRRLRAAEMVTEWACE